MAAPTAAPVVLVLAAGTSTRLPPDKLVMDVGGMPMIDRTLRALRASERVSDVVLVLPPGGKERYSWLRSVNTHLLENPDPAKGMISSIRVGLASAWAKERPFLLMPADVPFVPASAVTRVVVELFARRCKIVLPAYRGLGGHPGAFSADLHDEFFRHGDKEGTREILLRHRAETVRLNLPDPDICFDVDTPEDLAIAADAGARWARVEAQVEEKKAHGRAPRPEA
jgi:molybdenum cofactor cytidylyltransferase